MLFYKKDEPMKFKGHTSWKSAIEYNPEALLYGTPYFIITEEKGQIYFYEYDVASQQYVLKMQGDDSHFEEWYQLGRNKEKALREVLIQRGEIFVIR